MVSELESIEDVDDENEWTEHYSSMISVANVDGNGVS